MSAMLLAAQEWHFWIAPLLTAGAILPVLSLLVGYAMKVIGPRYPKR